MAKDGCTSNLNIFDVYYLQCTTYQDAIGGINWQLVVLLPATLEDDHVAPNSPYYIAVSVIALIAAVITLFALGVICWHWKSRVMQLTQPIFAIVVLLGCLALCLSCFYFLGKNTSTACTVRVYLLNLSLTLSFAPLLIKCWRVYAQFVRHWKVNVLYHGAQNKLITVHGLLFALGMFLTGDVLIVSLFVFLSGRRSASPYTVTVLTSNGAYAELTYCGYHDSIWLFYAEISYKGFLLLMSCYLVIIIRNVADAVAGVKVLVGIVYNTAIAAAIVVGLVRSVVSDIELVVLCETIGICYCVVVTCVLLTVPVLYRIYVVGDKAAAAVVIDQMFQARQDVREPISILFYSILFY